MPCQQRDLATALRVFQLAEQRHHTKARQVKQAKYILDGRTGGQMDWERRKTRSGL